MDNITQGILGGRISGLRLSQHHRTHKEPLTNGILRASAIITNIGDFDVLVRPLLARSDPLDAFFFHRALSHSLLLAALLAITLGFVCARIDKTKRSRRRRSGALFSSMVFGHLIIDLMTSYGIRLFLPFSDVILSLDNIFVVDFFFTGPLLVLFLCTLFAKTTAKKRIFARSGMAFAGIYLLITFMIQAYVRNVCTQALTAQNIPVLHTYVAPEPLQPFLRRCVARTERLPDPGVDLQRNPPAQPPEIRFLEDYLSLFDRKHQMFAQQTVHAYPQKTALVEAFANDPGRKRLANFSQGRRTAATPSDAVHTGGTIIIDVIKFGGIIGRKYNRNESMMFGFLRDPITKSFSQYSSRFGAISSADRNALRTRVWGNAELTSKK